MAEYLLSVHHDYDETFPPVEEMQPVFEAVDRFNQKLQDAGAWVFAGGLMPVTVPGVPKSTRIAVQVGPAINGTALRDATGQVSFNDFVNQVEYADAATALNTEMKADLLQELDPASLVGQDVTVVGATAPLNPEVITITPVSIEVTQ